MPKYNGVLSPFIMFTCKHCSACPACICNHLASLQQRGIVLRMHETRGYSCHTVHFGFAQPSYFYYIVAFCLPYCADIAYWDDRYNDFKEPFDWLVSYKDAVLALDSLIPDKTSRILMSGWVPCLLLINMLAFPAYKLSCLCFLRCGNADLGPDMHAAGFTNMVNIDLCTTVIAQQKERHPHMDWRVMDVMDLSDFGNDSFDYLIDKSMVRRLRAGFAIAKEGPHKRRIAWPFPQKQTEHVGANRGTLLSYFGAPCALVRWTRCCAARKPTRWSTQCSEKESECSNPAVSTLAGRSTHATTCV